MATDPLNQYQQQLQGDPWYMAQNNLLGAQGISDAAQRTQAVQQALIRFGQVPDFGNLFGGTPGTPATPGTPGTPAPAPAPATPWMTQPTKPTMPGWGSGASGMAAYQQAMQRYQQQAAQYNAYQQRQRAQAGTPGTPGTPGTSLWGQDVTELIRQAALQNTNAGLSQTAMIAKANADAQRGIKNNLASRGMLRSGETGFQLGEQSLRNQQAEYQARNELMDFLQNVYSSYAQSEQQRAAARLGSLQEAYGRQASRLPAA